MFLTRRQAMALMAAAPAAVAAQSSSQLPLNTSGLEHVGFTVPDPKKSASFYGRIFDPQIFQEMAPPLRYYCRLGIGYVAFGPNPAANPNAAPRIDHFCATVENYRLDEMRAELATKSVRLTGSPDFNALTDPDGIRMQFMGTPGGLLPTIIASTRVTQDDAICEAVGLDHVVVQVPDLEKSAAFYRTFFGKETARERTPERIWFTAARTRLGLEKVEPGQMPHIDRFGIRVVAFNRQAVVKKLECAGVTVLPSTDAKQLRFRDADGFTVEIRGV